VETIVAFPGLLIIVVLLGLVVAYNQRVFGQLLEEAFRCGAIDVEVQGLNGQQQRAEGEKGVKGLHGGGVVGPAMNLGNDIVEVAELSPNVTEPCRDVQVLAIPVDHVPSPIPAKDLQACSRERLRFQFDL
jgi:hypothetical protein